VIARALPRSTYRADSAISEINRGELDWADAAPGMDLYPA